MSNPSSLTRIIRYLIGLVVGGAIGVFLVLIIIADQSNDISSVIVSLSIILFLAGFFAGLSSFPGDANPFTIKLALFIFLGGLALSALLFFAGFGALGDMNSSSGFEVIGLLFIGLLLIVIAIFGVIATVVGSIVLIIGAFIGEIIAKSLFYSGTSFDKPISSSSKSKSKSQYCKSCGSEMNINDLLCPSCGSKA